MSKTKMTEAEVVLGLAKYLLNQNIVMGKIQFSLDGMHKKVFPDWEKHIREAPLLGRVEENTNSGSGDLVAELNNEVIRNPERNKLFVECKKGTFIRTTNSAEYKLMREAIGQIATIEKLCPDTLYAIAVPKSDKTVSLAKQWIKSEGIQRLGLRILLIDQEGQVWGLFKNDYE